MDRLSLPPERDEGESEAQGVGRKENQIHLRIERPYALRPMPYATSQA